MGRNGEKKLKAESGKAENSTIHGDRWPQGKRQRLTYNLADRFFSALSSSTDSLLQLLRDNPDFPPHSQLISWRRKKQWFAEAWRVAREAQAEFLMQKTLDIAKGVTKGENAHAARVQFDIYRHIAAKFHPSLYGDKGASNGSPNVSVAIAITPERLSELRGKLDATRRLSVQDRKGLQASSQRDQKEQDILTIGSDGNVSPCPSNLSGVQLSTNSHTREEEKP